MAQGQARTWAHGWVWLSGAQSQDSQGSEQLETGPAAVSLQQWLMVPGAAMSSRDMGRVEQPRGCGQGQ